jgi:hypothetical protein
MEPAVCEGCDAGYRHLTVAIEIVSSVRENRGGRSGETRSIEVLTQSTATFFQNVNMFVDTIKFGMGTATGFERNRYRLASGAVEGQQVSFLATATGEANLLLQVGTATALWVFSEPDDYMLTIYSDHKWRVVVSSATLASST